MSGEVCGLSEEVGFGGSPVGSWGCGSGGGECCFGGCEGERHAARGEGGEQGELRSAPPAGAPINLRTNLKK